MTPQKKPEKRRRRLSLSKDERQRMYSTYFSQYRRKYIAERAIKKTGKGRRRLLRSMTNPTRVTGAVREFARSFPDSIDGIHRMIESIRGFYTPEKNRAVLKHVYDNQTAHDIFTTGRIPAPFIRSRGTEPYPAWGCKSGCDALIAALKAKGAKGVRHVRTISDVNTPHSLVMFEWGGRKYLADPYPAALMELMMEREPHYPYRVRQKFLIQVGQTLRERIEELKRKKQWKEGKDSRELGITFRRFYEEGM